jgi:predicted transcriptional regulator
MKRRTTFTLDDATVERLKQLAALWGVSLAEVVRRAVAQAEAQSRQSQTDPVALLRELHAKGLGLNPEQADAYLAQVRADRKLG